MPRVHFVKKARVPNRVVTKADIRRANNPKTEDDKGAASYYWWKFAYGSKNVSKTRPRSSQLTQSEYYSRMYAFFEELEDGSKDETFPDLLRDKAEEIRQLGEEQSDKHQNMPDSLQSSETGELLESRSQACETIADEMESAADDVEQAVSDIPDFDDLDAVEGETETREYEGEQYDTPSWEARKASLIEEACTEALGSVSTEFDG